MNVTYLRVVLDEFRHAGVLLAGIYLSDGATQ